VGAAEHDNSSGRRASGFVQTGFLESTSRRFGLVGQFPNGVTGK
jgi:hypothetical protein